MEFDYFSLAFLVIAIFSFLAGFVDAIVGGGGLVSVPMLFVTFPAAPVPLVIGTNRLASVPGTIVAAFHYLRHVRIPLLPLLLAVAGASSFSYLGATISKLVQPETLKPIMLFFMIGVAVYTYSKKELGQVEDTPHSAFRTNITVFLIGATLGFYNGFFGPGTGSLLVFGLVSIAGFSFLRSSAMAKIINVIADISSLVFFATHGFVFLKLSLAMGICQIVGSIVGSRMAVLRGNRFIRYVFLIVISGLIIRFGYDVLKLW